MDHFWVHNFKFDGAACNKIYILLYCHVYPLPRYHTPFYIYVSTSFLALFIPNNDSKKKEEKLEFKNETFIANWSIIDNRVFYNTNHSFNCFWNFIHRTVIIFLLLQLRFHSSVVNVFQLQVTNSNYLLCSENNAPLAFRLTVFQIYFNLFFLKLILLLLFSFFTLNSIVQNCK